MSVARIREICGPLFGSPNVVNGIHAGTVFLPLERQCAIYRRALRLLLADPEAESLLALAVYRRQLIQPDGEEVANLFDDLALLLVALQVFGSDNPASSSQWRKLETRLPDASHIAAACRTFQTRVPEAAE